MLLFQPQQAGPLDANLLVTSVYFLTLVMFVVSLYHTLSLRKGLRKEYLRQQRWLVRQQTLEQKYKHASHAMKI